MASMTIRNIDERVKSQLRVRAAENGRSMEDEARDILKSALAVVDTKTDNLATAIRRRVELTGGVDIELPPRSPMREPIDFGE